MTLQHGIQNREVPTSVRPPIRTTAGLPVVVGLAPVVLGDRANVNKPVLVSSFAEFESKLGYCTDFANYGLCEFARVYFGLYGVGPAVFVNVLDPDEPDHVEAVARAAFAFASGEMSKTIAAFGVDHDSLVLDDGAAGPDPAPVVYELDVDYTLAYDADGNTIVTRIAGGAMGSGVLASKVAYSKLKPSGVVAADVVGATTTGGANTGLYCLEDVFPQLQLAPGMIVCPGWSHEPTVMAAMVARGASINGAFMALSVCDLSPDGDDIADYSEAAAWKTTNGYSAANLVVCWPLVTLGSEVHHLSSHFAGLANLVDAGAGGVPYQSPSNRALQIDGCCLLDGTEVFLTQLQGNVLNGQGIVTALNFTGWRLWGNRTAAYPGTSDPKDAFVPIRRMNLWLGNTLTLTHFSQVDSAMNRRLIESVVDSANIYLNGLKGQGAIVGGECVFAEADNPLTELADGHATFRIYWTPPPPAEAIMFVIEYDATALAALFG